MSLPPRPLLPRQRDLDAGTLGDGTSGSGGGRGRGSGRVPEPNQHQNRQQHRGPGLSGQAISLGKYRAEVACIHCRRKRTKCNGARPSCLRCSQTGAVCEYQVPQMESLKRQVENLKSRTVLYEAVFEILRTRPDEDVSALLQRVRAGEDVEDVLRFARDGDLLMQYTLDPTNAHFRYRFPLVDSMPAFLLDVDDNVYLKSILYHRTIGQERESPRGLIEAQSSGGSRWSGGSGGSDNATAATTAAAAGPGSSPSLPSGLPPGVSPGVSPTLPPELPEDYMRMYNVPFHAVQMIEPRMQNIRASTWTSVTSSDTLVRKLLETYFIHMFPDACFFHKDYFLEDMAAGRERYCSSLLVNAVLAAACHGHTGLTNRSHFWSPQTLTYQFLAEARRLWEFETRNRPCKITTTQAGSIICFCLNGDGLDKIGTSYLAQTVAMATENGLFSPETYRGVSNKHKAMLAATAWGIFSWQSIVAFAFFQPPMVPEPPPSLPSLDEAHHSSYAGEVWVRYPSAQTLVPFHHGLCFRAIAGLRCIMVRIAHRVFGRGRLKGSLSLREAMGFRRALLGWYAALPPPLTSDKIVLPAQLKIHIEYHHLMMMLFEPPVAMALDGLLDAVDSDLDGEGGGGGGGCGFTTKGATPSPAAIVAYSKACFETLFRLYYLRHSFEGWDMVMMHFMTLASFSTLARFQAVFQAVSPSPSRQPNSQAQPNATAATAAAVDQELHTAALSSVLLCAQGLRDHARNCHLSEVVFRLLRDAMPPQEVGLLGQFRADLDPVEEEMLREAIVRQVSSQYPVDITGVADDVEKKRIDVRLRSNRETAGRGMNTDEDWDGGGDGDGDGGVQVGVEGESSAGSSSSLIGLGFEGGQTGSKSNQDDEDA